VRVVFRAEPDRPYTGEVARLGRQTDPETREFLVDVRLSALPANWTIGQRAEAYITTGRSEGSVVVPVTALQIRQGRPGVFVAADGRARWRAIEPGLRGRDVVEVKSGLTTGERIALPRDPRMNLSDGDRIAGP
jgi:multidrug efflux pump subunit AcrA (membrane-fusion protein)